MQSNANLLALADWLDEKNAEHIDKVRRSEIPFLAFTALALRYDACRDWGASGYRHIENLETFAPGAAADAVAQRYASRPAERFAVAETLAALASALHRDSLAAQEPVETTPELEADTPGPSTEDRNAAIVAARAAGTSYGRLAEQFSLSKSTLHNIVKEAA